MLGGSFGFASIALSMSFSSFILGCAVGPTSQKIELVGKSQMLPKQLGIYLILVYWQKLSVISGNGLIHEMHCGQSSLFSPSRAQDGQGWTRQVCLPVHQWQAQAPAPRESPAGSRQVPRGVLRCEAGRPPLPQVLCTGTGVSLNP